jgi:carbon storage regulator
MLVLARKAGESILIGDDIVIKVVTAGRKVHIGIEGPRHVPIVRAEIADQRPKNASVPFAGETARPRTPAL